MTIWPVVGGGICVGLGLAVEIAAPLVVWLFQNRLSGLLFAVGVLGCLALGRFSLTQPQVAKT